MTMDTPRTCQQLQTSPRPVAALALDYAAGSIEPAHQHPRAQLLFATSGTMSVATSHGAFVVAAPAALWIPPGVRHEVCCRGPVTLRTLYLERQVCLLFPSRCTVMQMSPLLQALIEEATRAPVEYAPHSRDQRLMVLLLDELSAAPTVPQSAPMPQDERLSKVCRAILRRPAETVGIEECARMAGVSRRTFTRLFRRETGMRFAEWRQHVRLYEALSRLTVGRPVTTVAYDVGYQSPSAFAAIFRRTFGTTPTAYFQTHLASPGHHRIAAAAAAALKP
jgi:AraC-like DNA-binding protein